MLDGKSMTEPVSDERLKELEGNDIIAANSTFEMTEEIRRLRAELATERSMGMPRYNPPARKDDGVHIPTFEYKRLRQAEADVGWLKEQNTKLAEESTVLYLKLALKKEVERLKEHGWSKFEEQYNINRKLDNEVERLEEEIRRLRKEVQVLSDENV
jgi:predicted metal-dependent phosphoesterase TrpH